MEAFETRLVVHGASAALRSSHRSSTRSSTSSSRALPQAFSMIRYGRLWRKLQAQGWELRSGSGLSNFTWVAATHTRLPAKEVYKRGLEGRDVFYSQRAVFDFAIDQGWVTDEDDESDVSADEMRPPPRLTAGAPNAKPPPRARGPPAGAAPQARGGPPAGALDTKPPPRARGPPAGAAPDARGGPPAGAAPHGSAAAGAPPRARGRRRPAPIRVAPAAAVHANLPVVPAAMSASEAAAPLQPLPRACKSLAPKAPADEGVSRERPPRLNLAADGWSDRGAASTTTLALARPAWMSAVRRRGEGALAQLAEEDERLARLVDLGRAMRVQKLHWGLGRLPSADAKVRVLAQRLRDAGATFQGDVPSQRDVDDAEARSQSAGATPIVPLQQLSLVDAAVKKSRYRGVSWNRQRKKWWATIYVKGKTYHLGTFDDEVATAQAYDVAAARHGKELNFPDGASANASAAANAAAAAAAASSRSTPPPPPTSLDPVSARSVYRGLGWHRKRKMWQARIMVNRTLVYIGSYASEVDAARAYDAVAARHGQVLNFPADAEAQPAKRRRVVKAEKAARSDAARSPPPPRPDAALRSEAPWGLGALANALAKLGGKNTIDLLFGWRAGRGRSGEAFRSPCGRSFASVDAVAAFLDLDAGGADGSVWERCYAGGCVVRTETTQRTTLARLAVGGALLPQFFDTVETAADALRLCAARQVCVCGRRDDGRDYVACAAGAEGRCRGRVHRRCVGLADCEAVPAGYRCPLDAPGAGSAVSAFADEGPLVAGAAAAGPRRQTSSHANKCAAVAAMLAPGAGADASRLGCLVFNRSLLWVGCVIDARAPCAASEALATEMLVQDDDGEAPPELVRLLGEEKACGYSVAPRGATEPWALAAWAESNDERLARKRWGASKYARAWNLSLQIAADLEKLPSNKQRLAKVAALDADEDLHADADADVDGDVEGAAEVWPAAAPPGRTTRSSTVVDSDGDSASESDADAPDAHAGARAKVQRLYGGLSPAAREAFGSLVFDTKQSWVGCVVDAGLVCSKKRNGALASEVMRKVRGAEAPHLVRLLSCDLAEGFEVVRRCDTVAFDAAAFAAGEEAKCSAHWAKNPKYANKWLKALEAARRLERLESNSARLADVDAGDATAQVRRSVAFREPLREPVERPPAEPYAPRRGVAACPLVGRVLLRTPCEDEDEDDMPLLLRCVGVVARHPPCEFDDDEEDIDVVCVGLVGAGAGDANYVLPLYAAREAVRNRESAEAAALQRRQRSGVRFRYRPSGPESDCGACRFCRDRPSRGGAGTLRRACELQQRQRLATLIDDIFPEAHTGQGARPRKREAPGINARPRKRRKRTVGGDVEDVAPVGDVDAPVGGAVDGVSDGGGAAAAAGESATCAICQDDLDGGAAALSCGHSFHGECLDALVRCNKLAAQTRRSAYARCPLCRKSSRHRGAAFAHAALEA
ncbi:hypothetical protein M885DRAFT_509803 [Pelagophyceae sp. CCMP2097]|nr:hypothetical protein M885DRAFT_509803 [Pelagophyceae sp. CCMP2097]